MRQLNQLASLLLGLALVTAGTATVLEVLLVALDRPGGVDRDGWYGLLTRVRLGDPGVRVTAVVTTLVGVLILVAQLRRWTPYRLVVPALDAGWHLPRRSVQRRLARAAGAVPGIERVRARIVRDGSAWRPRLRAVGDPAAQEAVERAVRRELHRLGFGGPVPVTVRVRAGRDRSRSTP